MAERLDEVSAAVPFGAFARRGLEIAGGEEQFAPRQHAQTHIERERQLVVRVRRLHRSDAPHIGPQRLEVTLLDLREGVERHARIEIGAVGADALVERVLELRIGPVADAGFAGRT